MTTTHEEARDQDFLAEFRARVNERAADVGDDGQGAVRIESFVEVWIEDLLSLGQINDVEYAYVELKKGTSWANCFASGFDDAAGQLELVAAVFHDSYEHGTVPAKRIEQKIRHALNVIEVARKGQFEGLEPASPAFGCLDFISARLPKIESIRIIVLVDGSAKTPEIPGLNGGSPRVSFDVWDWQRLSRGLATGRPYESIEIDIAGRLGTPLPCLKAPEVGGEYSCILASIPGQLLYEIYHEYGPRVLELNVRSFLQARGKVNRGIRDTLADEPHRFLAYNNGLSLTAESVALQPIETGGLGIAVIRGLQIVNGGQTVASIHRAHARDKVDLKNVHVQAKITVVEDGDLDELVPRVSRFANTQNRVNEADFSANHPFHVELQRLSERTWAPGETTRWFYERARGQYEVARNREGTTPAKRTAFEQKSPRAKRFDKILLAKSENSWGGGPHVVSRGGQKNFVYYMEALAKRHGSDFEPDPEHYQGVVGRLIAFKAAEKVARDHKLPAYRANAVTYAIALLGYRSAGRIDFQSIWNSQECPETLRDVMYDWIPEIHQELVDSAIGANVTEWCKKEECWRHVQTMDLELPDDFEGTLLKGVPLPTVGSASGKGGDSLSTEDRDNIARVLAVPVERWVSVVAGATSSDSLKYWESGIVQTLLTYAAGGWKKVPSAKQAKHAVRILRIAEDEGWVDGAFEDDT